MCSSEHQKSRPNVRNLSRQSINFRVHAEELNGGRVKTSSIYLGNGGMASISKSKGKNGKSSKNWHIQFYFEGEKYHKSLKVSTKRDAVQMKQIIERRIAEGTFDPSKMLRQPNKIKKLSELVEKWETYTQKRRDITPGAAYQYKAAAKKMIEIIGDVLLKNITTVFIKDEFLLELDNLYTPRTVRSKMTSLRAMFSYAERNGFVNKNPFRGNVPSYQRIKPIFFRESEIEIYKNYWLDPARKPWQRVYFATIFSTGNRKMEHLKLKWSNVFLDQCFIKFKGKGKHGGKERTVPLEDMAIDILKNAERQLGNDDVFWQIKKTKNTIDSAWRIFKEKTQFPYKIHNIRSNRASWMVMKGYPVEKVMRIMGWEDYDVYKLYTELSPDYIMEDRNLLNQLS